MSAVLALSFIRSSHAATGQTFSDPLDVPSCVLDGAQNPALQPILAVTQAGTRLVGVGLRGLIVVSDDRGVRWRQVGVPVQSDLTAVQFPTPQQGWAVGHEGVILHSADGGQTWTKQLDGRMTQDSLPAYYKQRIDAGETALKPFFDEVTLNTQSGPTLPYLSVIFDDEKTGYAVGSFGMIIVTDDGGKTWRPWLDHIDNPGFLNLNDIRRIGNELYIAGERGTVYRLDRARQRFVSISTAYKGSFFGVVGDQDFLLAFGLAGMAYRSTDDGASWSVVKTGIHTSATAASLSSDGRQVLLATEDGRLVSSTDQGRSFKPLRANQPMLYAGMSPIGGGDFVLAGYQGLAQQAADAGGPIDAAGN